MLENNFTFNNVRFGASRGPHTRLLDEQIWLETAQSLIVGRFGLFVDYLSGAVKPFHATR